MILADTSAWIEYDRATGSAVDERLQAVIAAEQLLAVTEPVMMEAPGWGAQPGAGGRAAAIVAAVRVAAL